MPLYEYLCPNQHINEFIYPISSQPEYSECFNCGEMAKRIISAPLLVKASADVCYDSPIDGRPITSHQARQEDLKRNGCREYDPGMKQDYHTHLKDAESKLDRSIDAGVEETIAKMPTAKRGKLYSELTEQGVQADVVRLTPNG